LNILWAGAAWEDYTEWQRQDRATVAKINQLVDNIQRTPFAGLGKPEPLRGPLAGWWSRRISGEHRLVYRVAGTPPDQRIEIVQCRYHY
jgi:toxin YoeB